MTPSIDLALLQAPTLPKAADSGPAHQPATLSPRTATDDSTSFGRRLQERLAPARPDTPSQAPSETGADAGAAAGTDLSETSPGEDLPEPANPQAPRPGSGDGPAQSEDTPPGWATPAAVVVVTPEVPVDAAVESLIITDSPTALPAPADAPVMTATASITVETDPADPAGPAVPPTANATATARPESPAGPGTPLTEAADGPALHQPDVVQTAPTRTGGAPDADPLPAQANTPQPVATGGGHGAVVSPTPAGSTPSAASVPTDTHATLPAVDAGADENATITAARNPTPMSRATPPQTQVEVPSEPQAPDSTEPAASFAAALKSRSHIEAAVSSRGEVSIQAEAIADSPHIQLTANHGIESAAPAPPATAFGQTPSAALPSPAREVANQILDSLHSAVQNDQRTVTVDLSPPELGRVVIRLHQGNDGIEGELEVHRSETRLDVERALPHVVQNLQAGGLQVRRLEVQANPADTPDNQDTAEFFDQAGDRPSPDGSASQDPGSPRDDASGGPTRASAEAEPGRRRFVRSEDRNSSGASSTDALDLLL